MTLTEFKKRFKLAACFCRDFTDKHINSTLPKAIVFKVDDKELHSVSEILKRLTSKEGFPVWVDLYVSSFDDNKTIIQLTYSEDSSVEEVNFYHKHEGLPPFHIIGPTVPQGWQSLEKDGPFSFREFP